MASSHQDLAKSRAKKESVPPKLSKRLKSVAARLIPNKTQITEHYHLIDNKR
jgi:hypothetical protein